MYNAPLLNKPSIGTIGRSKKLQKHKIFGMKKELNIILKPNKFYTSKNEIFH